MATTKRTAEPLTFLPEIVWSWELPGLTNQIQEHREILVIEDNGLEPHTVAVVLHPDDFKALLIAAGRSH